MVVTNAKFILFAGIAMLIALIVSAISTGILIPKLKAHQFEQAIRDFGPQSHLKKQGTPSMGGIAMIIGIIVATIVVSLCTHTLLPQVWVSLVVMILYAAIGFADDYKKAIEKKSDGLSAKKKLLFQFLACILFALYCYYRDFPFATDWSMLHMVWIPFYGMVDFGIWYIPWVIFVMIAFTNSVNLTDGLDGLASSITAIVSFFMVLASVLASGFLMLTPVYGAVMGACLGFLLYNHYPAKIFMGDTGSMALGGIIAATAIMMHMEIFLAIAGLIYALESLSVILQVSYFKITHGKRIFRMSPIHHHFELGGMKETQIVFRFCLFTVVCCIIMLLGIK